MPLPTPIPVRWLIPEVLRRYAEAEIAVEVATPATVGGALDALFVCAPALRPRVLDAQGRLFPYLLIVRNRTALRRNSVAATQLASGDVLDLIGMAEGG